MYNEEILEIIMKQIGKKKTIEFCNIISLMYDIKYNTCKNINSLSEFDYERDWWKNVEIDLKKI